MMTIEVFTRTATARTHELAERLLTGLITEDGAPEEVIAAARELTHVIVHEPAVWATGGPDKPRYVVRVTVPGSWNSNTFGEHMIPRITAIVGEFEDDPGRLTRQPHCIVQVVGLKEHGIGTLGRVTTGTEITRLITDGYRGTPKQAAAGNIVDPVCGMAVDPATATLTIEHDGTTYAFCAPACRKVFAEDHGITVPGRQAGTVTGSSTAVSGSPAGVARDAFGLPR